MEGVRLCWKVEELSSYLIKEGIGVSIIRDESVGYEYRITFQKERNPTKNIVGSRVTLASAKDACLKAISEHRKEKKSCTK